MRKMNKMEQQYEKMYEKDRLSKMYSNDESQDKYFPVSWESKW